MPVGGDDKNPAPLTDYLQNDPNFSPLIALNNDVVRLIYPPLFGNISCYHKRETGSWKWVAFMFCYEIHLHGLHVHLL